MIKLREIDKTYNGFAGKVEALKKISIEIKKGEYVLIVGKSGSGKSTLLNVISGIDRPESGELIVNDQALNGLSENTLAQWRGRNIGIVFQFYQLLPTLTAMENITFAMEVVNKIPKKERKARAESLLEKVSLLSKRKKYPNELSGGERQRVAIARALANDPSIIVADEPTGNLDTNTGEQIHDLFKLLNKEGKTIVMVTHENIQGRTVDQIIRIKDGMLES